MFGGGALCEIVLRPRRPLVCSALRTAHVVALGRQTQWPKALEILQQRWGKGLVSD